MLLFYFWDWRNLKYFIPWGDWLSFAFFLSLTFFPVCFWGPEVCQVLFYFLQLQLSLQQSSPQFLGITIYSSCSSISHCLLVSIFQKFVSILDHFYTSFSFPALKTSAFQMLRCIQSSDDPVEMQILTQRSWGGSESLHL